MTVETLMAAGILGLLTCSTPICQAEAPPGTSPGTQTVGWRGDGSGKYPDATPPIRWGRVAKSILSLRSQAARPKEGETGQPIPDGVIREWLVLGPMALPEDLESLKAEILPGEGKFSPDVGEEVKSLKWQRVVVDTAAVDFRQIFNVEGTESEAQSAVAYAHARIYSETGAPLSVVLMGAGRNLKFWVNGLPTAANFNSTTLKLSKGWNSLLFRSVQRRDKHNPSWFIRPLLFGGPGCEYETRNIVWSAPMPAMGIGSPIIVGDRIFMTADMCNLICVDKRDGKILWVRSTTYHDAATEAEKQAHPEVFQDIEPRSARLKAIDGTFSSGQSPTAETLKEKADLEKSIHGLMKTVDAKRYALHRAGEAGWAPMTPASDGKHVYVLFATRSLACYDLDGNRKWTALEESQVGEHSYTSSPVVVEGKVITYLDDYLRAFDAETGKLLWATTTLPGGKGSITYYKFHGTVCPVKAGETDCVFTPHGMIVRLSDGKNLFFQFFKLGGGRNSTPIFENGLVYKHGYGEGISITRLTAPEGDTIKPTWKYVRFKTSDFPHTYRGSHMSSPLLHEGLLYCVNIAGVLTVVDAEKCEVVYQKLLDADLFRVPRHFLRAGLGSSPTLGGQYLYIFGNQGTALVLKPGRTFELVAKNRIEQVARPKHWSRHQEVTITCPAFEDDRIYVRSEKNLYCIGEER